MNELPLRCIFGKLDGSTTGPNLHSGQIALKLLKATELEIAQFPIIPLAPEYKSSVERVSDISSDQYYLRDIILYISTGVKSNNFEKRSPGKLGYARWLTTANRILCVYISFKETSNILKRITLFVINVYARMWFEIIHASIHIFNMNTYLHSLKDYEITAWVEPVIQRNGYMMHSESILLAMLSDDDLQVK